MTAPLQAGPNALGCRILPGDSDVKWKRLRGPTIFMSAIFAALSHILTILTNNNSKSSLN
jgi:hypothetical protein